MKIEHAAAAGGIAHFLIRGNEDGDHIGNGGDVLDRAGTDECM